MKIAQRRDAARSSKFYFRKDILTPPAGGNSAQEKVSPGSPTVPEEFEAMSCDDIFNGTVSCTPNIFPELL